MPPSCSCPEGFAGRWCELQRIGLPPPVVIPSPEPTKVVAAPWQPPEPTATAAQTAAAPTVEASQRANSLDALAVALRALAARRGDGSAAGVPAGGARRLAGAGDGLTPQQKWAKLQDLMDNVCNNVYVFATIKRGCMLPTPARVAAAGAISPARCKLVHCCA